jgi:hypothetical protein
MGNMDFAYKLMKSLLLEAELKEAFSSFDEGSKIRFVLADGSEETFEVQKNIAGRIIMVDLRTKIQYTFTKDAIKNGEITIHKFNSKKVNFEGAKTTLKLKEFVGAKKNGELINVDIVNEELNQRVTEANNEIRRANEGDILYISSEEKTSKGPIVNTILLKVVEVQKEMLTCILEGIESENEKGDTNSYTMDKLAKAFRLHNIYIYSNNLAKLDGDSISLPLLVSNKVFNIQNILAVELHQDETNAEDSEDAKELAKQEFLQKYGHSEAFKQAIEKTPSFWETFFNASPKGRSQIEKIINKSLTDNAYFTKGNTITFKLLTNTIVINREFRLIQAKKEYSGTIEKNNTIKIGTRKRGHWELRIVKEISPSVYKVKITFCNKDLNCESQGDGVIKVLRNG